MNARVLTRAKTLCRHLPQYLESEIWRSSTLREKSLRGRIFATLRLLSIIVDGVQKNRIPSQAAALSYYTLIALGPMLAIAIMISGFVIQSDQNQITGYLTKLVYFIAPSAETASEHEMLIDFEGPLLPTAETSGTSAASEEEKNVNPEIVQFLENVVDNARSGTVGVVGTLILIAISIQLFSTIEKTFNTIWGARQGRSFMQRLVFYWTFISLGTVVAFATLSLGIYEQTASIVESVPYSGVFLHIIRPLITFVLLILLFTFFNRAIPNTSVRWWPAVFGALSVTMLLLLNKNLTFIYVSFVIRQQSLFGSVGILPVLLFGLFVFWLFLLLGGQITYSVQNVNTLSNQRVWDNVSLRARESLSFAAFILIARRFQNCEPPLTAHQLALTLRAPSNIINSSLIRLVDMGLIRPIESKNRRGEQESRYQPAKPLEKISFASFKENFDTFGNNENLQFFRDLDPLLAHYETTISTYTDSENSDKAINLLFEEYPLEKDRSS